MDVPVVVVTGSNGKPLRINQSDYDANPGNFTLWSDEKEAAKFGQSTEFSPGATPSNIHTVHEVENAPFIDANTSPVNLDPVKQPTQAELLVVKRDKRYFVTDRDGNEIDGYEKAGYKTEAEAYTALYPAAK